MTLMTGRRALMEMLKIEGVEYVFGNPGSSEAPIMDELDHHEELKYILVLQEGVAMGMADGYARATRKPSFVNLHIETGLANGISLLHNAHEGGTPLVVSAGNKDIRELAQGRTDLAEMVRLFTKWTTEVTHPEQIPAAMRRAFNEARTPPTGPTFVGFSANALDERANMDIVTSAQGYYRLAPDMRAIEDASRLLASSKRPIIVSSDRVARTQASRETVRVAELLGARVHVWPFSEMNFPMNHPQFQSMIRLGFSDAKAILSEGDVVLYIGKLANYAHLFSDPLQLFFERDTKLIHLDIDASEVGKTQPTEVGIISDPKVALASLAKALEENMTDPEKRNAKNRAAALAVEKTNNRNAWQRRVQKRWNHRPMYDDRMIIEIAKSLPEDVTIIQDTSTSRDTLNQVFQFSQPDRFFGMRGGAIGWGIGGAMGVKLAQPNRPVVAFIGDGSAMMTIQGLWTAAVENIAVVYVILNNGAYRVLKQGLDGYKKQILQESDQSRHLGTNFPIPLNIAKLAQDMGVQSSRVEDPNDLKGAMERAMKQDKPTLIDVIIDGSV